MIRISLTPEQWERVVKALNSHQVNNLTDNAIYKETEDIKNKIRQKV